MSFEAIMPFAKILNSGQSTVTCRLSPSVPLRSFSQVTELTRPLGYSHATACSRFPVRCVLSRGMWPR